MEVWNLEWFKRLHLSLEEQPHFSVDTGEYYCEQTSNVGEVICEETRFTWGYPYVGFRDKANDNVMGHDATGVGRDGIHYYLQLIYDNVLNLDDYNRVLNHGYLLHIGRAFIGLQLACCDLSDIPKQRLKGFFLRLGQKKYNLVPKIEKEAVYLVKPVSSIVGQYRERCVVVLESVQKMGVLPSILKSDPSIYLKDNLIASYYNETILGRFDDAVALISNIDEPNLIIPGDGFGVFTKIGLLFGKNIVSGESSKIMVKWAKRSGSILVHEDGIGTVKRGIDRFGPGALILLSFLWSVAREIIEYCYDHDYRILVYDKFIYFKGSSKLIGYGSPILRGVRGIKWLNLPMKLSEEYVLKGHKPMLAELMRGPLFFDSVKSIQQISTYCEMYPDKVRVSLDSRIDCVELYEMSRIHHFLLVEDRPVIWFVRCPHNAGSGLTYDVDRWQVIPHIMDINSMVIGTVPMDHMSELCPQRLITKGGTVKGNKHEKVKIITRPRGTNGKIISKQNMRFKLGKKYYMKASARLTPHVRPIYVDDKVQLVWLKHRSYVYEERDSMTKYVRYVING